MVVTGRRTTSRVLTMLRWFTKTGVEVDSLPRSFWARASALAAARSKLRRPLLLELLAKEGLAPSPGPRRRASPPRQERE